MTSSTIYSSNRITFSFIFTWIILILILASSSNQQCEAAATSVRLCGDKLVKMVMGLCKGCIQGTRFETVAKRGQWKSLIFDEALDGRQNIDENESDEPAATGYYSRQSRRQGIATECCEKTCGYSYLKSFCCETTTTIKATTTHASRHRMQQESTNE